MAVIGRFLGVAFCAAACVVPICVAQADGPGALDSIRPPPLPEPLTPDELGANRSQADDIPRRDADIYHEFGTVTPGGARGGRHAPDYGGLVIGPGGVIHPAPPPKRATSTARTPTLAERQAETRAKIRQALRPRPPASSVRRQTLDDLYAKLAAAKDEQTAKSLASLIQAVWARSGSDTVNLLIARAAQAVGHHDFRLALRVLDQVVELQPNWAEGWNQRASVRLLAGDTNGAMADVDHVLKLEPNQFVALNNLAAILQRTGFDKRALQVYRRELTIYPHQPELEQLIETLSSQVEGQGI